MSEIQQGAVNLETDVQWQAESLSFGPDGFRTTKTGVAFHARARTEATLLQAGGWEGSVDPDNGPISTITATISALDPADPDADLTPKWGMDVQFKNVPAAQSQRFKAYIMATPSGFNGPRFRAIQAAVKQYQDDGTWTLFDLLTTGDDQKWALDIIEDHTLLEFDATLRRTNTYAQNTTQTADWVNVGKVFTTAQVLAIDDPPSSICGTIPTGYWLKTPASVDDGTDGRFTVNTLWLFGTAETYPPHQYPPV